jgi:cytochrome P450
MSFIQQYEQIAPDQTAERLALVNRWIRTDWRAFFGELRTSRPIFPIPGITMVTRFDDVVDILRRHREFTVRPYAAKMDAAVGPFMLGRDETELNWRDKSLMKAMMPLADLPRVRKRVAQITAELLDLQVSETLDVVALISRRVPVRLCGEYFGFPGPDETSMMRWSKTTQWDFFKNLTNDPAVSAAAVESGRQMKEYLSGLVEDLRRRQQPSMHTVVERLVYTSLPEELGFDGERLLANIAGLLVGSVETTSQAIVQALDQILRRPAVQKAATDAAASGNDAVLDAIVWEALRFDPINPLLFRFVEGDSIIAAGSDRQTILPARTLVFACTASAMNDEREIGNPDTFSPGRPAHHYLHFGYGHHECLGSQVGFVMIAEVIKQLLLRPGISRLPSDGSRIDFGGGPFPERYEIAVRVAVN